jgi:predicted glycoside hydrolase/deacetylase ChbG (UPF0249 family)
MGNEDLQFVVINADDFGIASHVSQAIVRCFEAGRISSTTIMANQEGFAEAVQLAHEYKLLDRIGVHLNLTSGKPLTNFPPEFLSPAGNLAVPESRIHCPSRLKRAVYCEVRAQVLRVLDAGIKPTHMDSHQHVLNGFPFTTAALAVAKEFGITRMRPARNLFYDRSLLKSIFKLGYNGYLSFSGVKRVKWFTDVKPYYIHRQGGGEPVRGNLELMCHPAARLKSPIEDYTTEADLLLGATFPLAISDKRLVAYSEL